MLPRGRQCDHQASNPHDIRRQPRPAMCCVFHPLASDTNILSLSPLKDASIHTGTPLIPNRRLTVVPPVLVLYISKRLQWSRGRCYASTSLSLREEALLDLYYTCLPPSTTAMPQEQRWPGLLIPCSPTHLQQHAANSNHSTTSSWSKAYAIESSVSAWRCTPQLCT